MERALPPGTTVRRSSWFWILIVAGGGLLACTSESVRRATYPPQFRYMTGEAVRSTMWKLAERSEALQTKLREGTPDSPEARADVVRILSEMEQIVSDLDPAGARTNHPLLDSNYQQFRADLALAKSAAEHDPPSYFLAGSVAGSCRYCHGPRTSLVP